MYQLLVACLSFLVIPVLIKKKFKLSQTIVMASLVLGVTSGIGFRKFVEAVTGVFLKASSLNTILVVMMVSVLGGVMKHYGILDVIVETMQKVVGSKKKTIGLIPALIGVLIIPGGALLSAPFVNTIGEKIGISPPRRAAINLVFRHMAMFIMPYSTSILIVSSSFDDVSIPFVIFLNSFFVLGIIIIGYFLYLKNLENDPVNSTERTLSNIKKLIIYTSPIYACVVVTGITGLPFYLTIFISLLIVYLLSDKKDFIKKMLQSVNVHIVITVTAVLIMQSIILQMTDMLTLFNDLFVNSGNMLTISLVLLAASFFFGYITGYQVASLAITLPLIAQLNVSYEMMHIYIYLATGCSFIGYFFSPLHLCQAFTVQIMGVSTGELYKEYRWFAPILLIYLMLTVFLMRLIIG
ncbi:MAG: DUF401 family protein [Tissierellales bacterium]|nr:DUF401 family protein [Tissierellales bacterium]MBN2827189.1 DUF401 family protein [Tissierellales bacterium]